MFAFKRGWGQYLYIRRLSDYIAQLETHFLNGQAGPLRGFENCHNRALVRRYLFAAGNIVMWSTLLALSVVVAWVEMFR